MTSWNLPYLSLILNDFVPLYDLQCRWEGDANHITKLVRKLRYIYRHHSNVQIDGAGSYADGLTCIPIEHPDEAGVPPRFTQTFDEKVEAANASSSDVDIMISLSHEFKIRQRSRDLHPGYAQLTSSRPIHKGHRLTKIPYFIETKHYTLLPDAERVEHRSSYEKRGPAQTLCSDYYFKGRPQYEEVDRVFCISYPGWPDQASGWLQRHRPSGWPSQTLIDKVKSGGCHFVPVAHPTSSQPDIEWRFSFSQAEVALAQSLTCIQKQCYAVFKTLCKQVFCKTERIGSYILKTVMFWSCEKKHSDDWKPLKLAECLFFLLDELMAYLQLKQLPNYFIRDNNMISHFDVEKITYIVDRLKDLKKCLLQYIKEYKDNYIFLNTLDTCPFRSAFLNGMRLAFHENASLCSHGIMEVSRSSFHRHLSRGDPIHAIKVIENMLKCDEQNATNCVSHHLKDELKKIVLQDNKGFMHRWARIDSEFIHKNSSITEQGIIHLAKFQIEVEINVNMSALRMMSSYPEWKHVDPDFYSDVQSKAEETLLEKMRDTPHAHFKSYVLLCYSYFLFITDRYQDAYRYAKEFFELKPYKNLPFLMNPAIALCSLLESIHIQTAKESAYALYMMVKAIKKGKLIVSGDELKTNFVQVISEDIKIFRKYDYLLVASSYIDRNQYLFAILHMLLGASNLVIRQHIIICLVLELLLIAASEWYVTSHRFKLLAQNSLRLLRDPQKTESADDYPVSHVLRDLARVYEEMLSAFDNQDELVKKCSLACWNIYMCREDIHYGFQPNEGYTYCASRDYGKLSKRLYSAFRDVYLGQPGGSATRLRLIEKCYMAYRSALEDMEYCDPELLQEFMYLLDKTGHPDQFVVHGIVDPHSFLEHLRRANDVNVDCRQTYHVTDLTLTHPIPLPMSDI